MLIHVVRPNPFETVWTRTILHIRQHMNMDAPDNNEKFNRLCRPLRQSAELARVNYCIPGVMSRCTAGLIWQEHRKCKYAVKSTLSDRCMHYIESIYGHCDNVNAQRGQGSK